MPNVVRALIRGTLRTLPAEKSGTLDNGQRWSFYEVEILDSDMNKVNLRVQAGMGAALTVGQAYDFEVDAATTGRPKFSVVKFQAVAASKAA